jgi:hypothetical protein
MSNVERDAEKERFWREVLSRQASFYAWRRTIAERDGAKAPSFVPVVVTDPAPGGPPIAIELVSGHVLRLPASTSAVWLAELVLALEAGAAR